MRSKRLSAFAATFLSVAAFAAFNPPQYTNTYTSGGVTYAQFGGVKSSNYVATAVANLWMASNYVDAVASEFEDGTRTVRDAQNAGDASSAGTSYYLAGDSWEDQYNADDLLRASTNAALSVSGTLEWRLTNGYLKVASAESADTATSADTAQNAANVAWDANGNYMSGSEIYARVMEDVPRPGNYSAVSNAAMSARDKTDLEVYAAETTPWTCSEVTASGEYAAMTNLSLWTFTTSDDDEGRQKYPEIWYNGTYIGGCNSPMAYDDFPTATEWFMFYGFDLYVTFRRHIAGMATGNRLATTNDIPHAVSVVAPSTNAVKGTAADARATGKALYTGFTEWVVEPSGYSVEWSTVNNLWQFYDEVGEPVGSGDPPNGTNPLTETLADTESGFTATRHLVTPTKTSQLVNDGSNGVPFVIETQLGTKQDTLPYATNAIPFAAITGSPTPPSVFYDTAASAASVSGATLTYQAASNSVGSVALLAGTNVLHITAPIAITGHVRDFGLTVTTDDAATITLDSSVSWRFDAANTNLAAGSWNRVYCTESPTGVFSLQLWTPDSAQEATP